MPTPAYNPFLTLPPLLGREVLQVPMTNDGGVWKFDVDRVQEAFDEGGALLVLCNPNNPLGRVFSRAELVALSEVVARNGGRVFADEVWSPLTFEGTTALSYATLDEQTARHTITSVSASKAFNLPGLKCAQILVSCEADRALLQERAKWLTLGASNLGMIANTVAFREGQEWLDKALVYLQRNRDELADLVAEHLPGVTFSVPEGTYIAWLDFTGIGIEAPGDFFAPERAWPSPTAAIVAMPAPAARGSSLRRRARSCARSSSTWAPPFGRDSLP
ncbi:MAG: aminotransferase class I/II-fold pyridoxal phosphate-dependent enzyme [Ilumatobacteraceae bacterium]